MVVFVMVNEGKYTSPMDLMGLGVVVVETHVLVFVSSMDSDTRKLHVFFTDLLVSEVYIIMYRGYIMVATLCKCFFTEFKMLVC